MILGLDVGVGRRCGGQGLVYIQRSEIAADILKVRG